MSLALRIENLWKSYSAGVHGCSVRVWALRGCSLHVECGERVAIVGSPGSGKTTLFHCIAGTRRPDAGRIDVSLPIRCCLSEPAERVETMLRLAGHALLLVDGHGGVIPFAARDGAALVASRDVASVFHHADRVMLLRDGRLSQVTHAAVRRVAERSLGAVAGSVVR